MWKIWILIGLLELLPGALVEARGADPARVDSFLAAVSDTARDLKQRIQLAQKAVGHDRSGKAMHVLARLHLEREGLA